MLTLQDLETIIHGPLDEIPKEAKKLPWLKKLVNDVIHLKLGSGTKLSF